jgi:hypothetical protein
MASIGMWGLCLKLVKTMMKEKLESARKAGIIKIKGPLTAKAHSPAVAQQHSCVQAGRPCCGIIQGRQGRRLHLCKGTPNPPHVRAAFVQRHSHTHARASREGGTAEATTKGKGKAPTTPLLQVL